MASDIESEPGRALAPEAGDTQDTPKKDRSGLRKRLLIIVAVVVVVALGGTFAYITYQNNNFVTTDNASVQSDMVTIPSQMTGTILTMNVQEGQYVHKGDVIAQLDPSSVDPTQIDNSYIRSTVNGTVLKTTGTTGQMIAAGQVVAYVTQDSQMFVTANIAETSIDKVKLGQNVNISIDQFGGQAFYGKVAQIGAATQSAFSIVPSTSSGTFIKTTQLVPVQIDFVQQYPRLIVGTDASVTIHVS